jgi:glycosyltransferase A (GT-A) superfamily protein (DUF2064 family)
MAKVAVLGRVKTRLGREIGGVEALRFYRATRRVVLLRLQRDPRFRTIVAIDPATMRDRALPRVYQIGQVKGDLGRRMGALLAVSGTAPVILIGTDIPGVRADPIAKAFYRLKGASAVIGPADDGGFWLYGARRVPRLVIPFDGVRWSAPETRADVVRNLGAARWAEGQTLSDVDSADDLKRLRPLVGRVVMPRV